MISFNKQPLSVNVLFEGTLVEKLIHEDEWEIYHHGFVVEIAIDQTQKEECALALHWKSTEPNEVFYWEQRIMQQAADELLLQEPTLPQVYVMYG